MEKTGIIWTERNKKIAAKQTGAGNSFYGKRHTDKWKAKNAERTRLMNSQREYANTPFKKLKKEMKQKGFDWCRICQDFYLSANVYNGLCRHHQNESYRKSYAKKPDQIRLRVHARKRKLATVPIAYKIFLFEIFNGRCAYCNEPATSIDHFFAVNKGGKSVPGNLLPCCTSCNSKKKDKLPSQWKFNLTDDIFNIIIPGFTKPGSIHHIIN